MPFEWKGVFPALLTPFTPGDELDLKMFEKNLQAQLDAGVGAEPCHTLDSAQSGHGRAERRVPGCACCRQPSGASPDPERRIVARQSSRDPAFRTAGSRQSAPSPAPVRKRSFAPSPELHPIRKIYCSKPTRRS